MLNENKSVISKIVFSWVVGRSFLRNVCKCRVILRTLQKNAWIGVGS